MMTISRHGLATALAVMIAAPSAFAHDTGSGESGQHGMMQGEGMMGQGGMSGMMGMMQMMQACTEMMQAMTTQSSPEAPATGGQDR